MLDCIVFLFSCKTDPEVKYRPPSMSDGEYSSILRRLESARQNMDYFEVGVQLANLEAPSADVFRNLNRGVRQDPLHCDRVVTWEMIRREGGFYNNIVIVDTVAFANSLVICKELMGAARYDSLLYVADNQKEYVETSTEIRYGLIDTLERLFVSDQNDRKLLSGPDRKRLEQDKVFRAKIEYSDSINLLTALEVIQNYGGYPETKYVGREHNNVLWFVFQHVSDLDARLKYRPILTDAVDREILGHGTLEAYDKRTQQIKWKEGR